MQIYNVDDFPYQIIQSYDLVEKPKRARGKRYEHKYKDVVCAFDIECTNIKRFKQSVMYVWQFAFDEHFVVMGRTWSQYKTFIKRLCEQLEDNEYLCVYVHNLSYEFEWLMGQFDLDDVFAVKSRKVLTTRSNEHIEYRCSYLHSNMSLHDYTEKLEVTHKKLDGDDFDYSKNRYYFTPLTDKEIEYCVNDVIGVVECIKKEMQIDGDTLYTIPLTSTGYVRRDMKEAFKQLSHKWIKSLQPDYDTYVMLRKAFRGGNTHANRHYVCNRDDESMIYDNEDVITMDMASAYPAVILNGKFPISKFETVDKPNHAKLLKCMNEYGFACLMYVRFDGIRLKRENWGCPYIPKDKSICIQNAIFDNGRILSADSLEMWLTDIDYKIIESEYNIDNCVVYHLKIAKYGYLPEQVKEVVRKYFKLKTELKDVDGQEIYYMKSKNKLNACYGMFAQNPVIFELFFDELEDEYNGRQLKQFRDILQRADYSDCETQREYFEKRDRIRKEFIKQEVEKLQQRANFPYQWGVWVTALCRQQLEKGIRNVYKYYDPFECYFIYTDTDSVKYSDPKHKVKWDDLNAEIETESRKNNGVAVKDGKEYIIGIYEQDKHIAKSFRTLGAKRYVYVDEKGNLTVTIAGVNKEKGAEELILIGGMNAFMDCKHNDQLLKDGLYKQGFKPLCKNSVKKCRECKIKNKNKYLLSMGGYHTFKDKVRFHKAGGTKAYYNDCGGPPIITPFGVLDVPPNIYIEDNFKTISRTIEYTELTRRSAIEFVNNFGLYCERTANDIDIYDL